VQHGGITKTGNAHLRRVVVEAAWAYQHRPNVIGYLLTRQKDLAINDEVKDIAWNCRRAGPRTARFHLAIGVRTEQLQKLATAA